MNAVTFDAYHSYDDLHLILSKKTIGTPSPKTEIIDIPGGDGVLDMTEFFGKTKYNNRTLTFEFSVIGERSEFMEVFATVQQLLHGRKMTIQLNDDPEWFYTGRISVMEFETTQNTGRFMVECDCEPYKQSIHTTTVSQTVSSNANIVLSNDKMPAVPTITTNAEFLISYGGYNDLYPAGTFAIPELELWEGVNQVYVEGNGKISFTYRKGRL